MAELNFRNLSIKYDNTKISKSSIRKNKTIEIIGGLCIFVALGGAIFFGNSISIDRNLALFIVYGFVSVALIMYGGIFVLCKIQEKISPRYFDLVTWLMKFKHDEIVVGWFNDEFIVELYNGRGDWMRYDLLNFIGDDYKLTDNSDKSKPIFMTIDLTMNEPEILTNNR